MRMLLLTVLSSATRCK